MCSRARWLVAVGANGRPFRVADDAVQVSACVRCQPKRSVRIVSEWAKRPLIDATASAEIYRGTVGDLGRPLVSATCKHCCQPRAEEDQGAGFRRGDRREGRGSQRLADGPSQVARSGRKNRRNVRSTCDTSGSGKWSKWASKIVGGEDRSNLQRRGQGASVSSSL